MYKDNKFYLRPRLQGQEFSACIPNLRNNLYLCRRLHNTILKNITHIHMKKNALLIAAAIAVMALLGIVVYVTNQMRTRQEENEQMIEVL